jgi:membrane protease YdiL (CAAX protease family)
MRSGGTQSGVAMWLLAIGSCGPTLVALVLSLLEGGRAGVSALFGRRARPAWYFYGIALFHILAAHLVATFGLVLAGRYTAQHLVYPPLLPEQVAIAILAPLGEEYGWRGYALPRLQSVMQPLSASLVIGVVWALWHVPTFLLPGATAADFLLTLPGMLAGSVLYTCMYNATGGSMRIVLLAHLGVHLDNVFRAARSSDGSAPLVSTSVVLVLFAAGLVAAGALQKETAVTTELAGARA